MFWFKESIKGVIIIIILFKNAKIWVGQTTLNKEKRGWDLFYGMLSV